MRRKRIARETGRRLAWNDAEADGKRPWDLQASNAVQQEKPHAPEFVQESRLHAKDRMSEEGFLQELAAV